MSNENSKLEYESGVTPTAMSALTDSGDRKTFSSDASQFSESSGNSPVIKPDGLLTGGVASAAVSGTDDVIDIAALSCNLAGVETAVSAGLDTAILRATLDVASVSSVTITSAGAIDVILGTDSADTTIVETRGVAGGPPLIPVGSIEIAQVRTTTNVAGPITAGEIFQTIGTHLEKSDFPVYEVDNFSGEVTFNTTLPDIHTGNVGKGVFASYAEPIFTEQNYANDFVPSETSHSVSSEQVYGATVGSSSSSLGQGSFTAILSDGITDNIIGLKNENLFFRYYQDKYKAPHILTQGKLGIGRTFGASDNPKVACTISSTVESSEYAS